MDDSVLPSHRQPAKARRPLLPRDLALIALFAALIAVLGLFGVLPLGPVAITAQTLGVMLAGTLLGPRRAVLAVLCFQALTLAGLPLLSGGRGGLAPLFGPSAGFLLGWLPGVAVIAWMAPRDGRHYSLGRALLANFVGGILVIYAAGLPVAAWRLGSGLGASVLAAVEFLPGDLLKVVLASLIGRSLFRAFPIPPAGVRRGES
ncbi:biotin transporter BioY [Pseudomonas sp. PDM23]|uniref:biotin transporter BioY n=1 Tax=unclassified Pseudomonas TaxID=196821 RepID=UPI001781BFB6|nr:MULTISPECIES: biotin transporter BioY [unclassified Pseudomonas]MBD9579190.1 biotin transporter BioY [Pseudomonas sp. PDM23]MBD9672824.1 biotin transporter BioY [Pseudomonas sp. PDM21]